MKHLGWFKGRIYQSSPRAFFIKVQRNTFALLHLAWQQSVICFRTLLGNLNIFIKRCYLPRWQCHLPPGGTATVAGGRYIFWQALFMKILKVPGKLRKQITLCCQALFYENIKSAWQSAEANYTLLPGTFFMKILKVRK